MGKPLSTDLRSRLVTAVAGGLSRRAAAERFGVSTASAVRWVQAVNTTGPAEAKPQGGDTRSRRIKTFREVILGAVQAQKDINLVELAELMRAEYRVALPRPPRHAFKKPAHAAEQGLRHCLGRRCRRAAQGLVRFSA